MRSNREDIDDAALVSVRLVSGRASELSFSQVRFRPLKLKRAPRPGGCPRGGAPSGVLRGRPRSQAHHWLGLLPASLVPIGGLRIHVRFRSRRAIGLGVRVLCHPGCSRSQTVFSKARAWVDRSYRNSSKSTSTKGCHRPPGTQCHPARCRRRASHCACRAGRGRSSPGQAPLGVHSLAATATTRASHPP